MKLAGSGHIGVRRCLSPSGYRSGSTAAVLAVIPRRPSHPYLIRVQCNGRSSPLIHGPTGEEYLPLRSGECAYSAFVMHPNAPIQLSDLLWPQGRAERRAGASLIRDASPASTGPAIPGPGCLAATTRRWAEMAALALRIMEGSASVAKQACYARRLIAAGERLQRRAKGTSGVVIEGEVLADT